METKRVMMLDIEGTTTPITFVSQTLFPYILENIGHYLEKTWDTKQTKKDIESLRNQVLLDEQSNLKPPQILPDSESKEKIIQSIIDNVKYNMERDRKITSLKQLQGNMWQYAYESGEVKGAVYQDVVDKLKEWKERETPVYIYSSGSVKAQKLLFQYSEHGDLLPFITGDHFDTKNIGSKIESSSYEKIYEKIKEREKGEVEIIFVTDNIHEANAAMKAKEKGANILPILSIREGTMELPENHPYKTITSFKSL